MKTFIEAATNIANLIEAARSDRDELGELKLNPNDRWLQVLRARDDRRIFRIYRELEAVGCRYRRPHDYRNRDCASRFGHRL